MPHRLALILLSATLAGCAARRAEAPRPAVEPPVAAPDVSEAAPSAAEATFTFAPPDGLVCQERRRQTVVKDAGKAGGTTEDVSDAVVRHRMARARDGWRLTSTMLSAQVSRNGTPVSEPVTAALVGREVVYVLAPDGSLREVRGLEDLGEAATRGVAPEMHAALRAMLDPATLERREKMDWQRRIGDLAGRRVQAGEVWEGQAELAGQGAATPLVTLTRFTRIEPRGDRTVVTIDFAYAGDRETAQRRLEQADPGAERRRSSGARDRESDAGRAVVVGDGSRVIEAGTMTVLSERLRQVTVAPTDLAGVGRVQVRRTDVRESVYDCAVAARTR